jgi:hypothetical protein
VRAVTRPWPNRAGAGLARIEAACLDRAKAVPRRVAARRIDAFSTPQRSPRFEIAFRREAYTVPAPREGDFMDSAALDARIAPPRTWPELAAEVQARADRQVYPLTGMPAADVRSILAAIKSLDRDEWGREWARMGERYAERARAAEKSDPKRAGEDYIMAWRFFGFGAWPTQSAPAKQAAFTKSLEAFAHFGRLQTPPIETVRIPFEGSEIVFYLQLPAGIRPAPVILTLGGLDSYKEYTAERYGPVYMANGCGFAALDAPGTCQAPLRAISGAERIYSRVIDHLLARKDVDPNRIALQGVSFGGFWANATAYAESRRLRAVVNWAGPIHSMFQTDWLLRAVGSREYLFDIAPALFRAFGVDNLDALLAQGPGLSLKARGLLDKPAPPMLLVNGEKDSLVAIDDLYLVLRNGPTPKYAWVNPIGIHLARSADWNDERIMREIIMPWLAQHVAPRA